jgi:aldose 1-epimerase
VNSYFNLSGAATIEGTEATLTTTKHLPLDDTDIPNGKIEDFPGIQANEKFTLGAKEPFIDHCFVFDQEAPEVPPDTRSLPMKKLVEMSHPSTGLHLEILSTEPAFQFYTGIRHLLSFIPLADCRKQETMWIFLHR